MKKLSYYYPILLIMISTLLSTCKKEKNVPNLQQEVTFTIFTSTTKNNSALKGALTNKLNDVKKIVLTIQNTDETPTNRGVEYCK